MERTTLLDLDARPMLPPDRHVLSTLAWHEFGALWNSNELAAAHDWLNERWSRLIRNSLQSVRDPEAEFLQGLAFATLALHFTQTGNQEGARLVLDDALVVLSGFRPVFLGVKVDPILATLNELRPVLAGLAPQEECPIFPFVYAKFEFNR